jgi:hypothetical protein
MPSDFDLLIYGGSPAGLGAAVAAAREGLRVLIAEPLSQIGGMITAGLSRTDLGRPETVGGLFGEFMQGILRHYQRQYGPDSEQVMDCLAGERFEPRVALAVLTEMVQQAGVEVRTNRTLLAARTDRGHIQEVELQASVRRETLTADLFADASYEGDLLAAAGARYRIGRESRDEYGEEYAGHLFWDPKSGRPTDEGTGESDDRIQAYCFRLCLTDDPARMIPIARPSDYDPGRYQLLSAYFAAAPRRLEGILLMGKLPNHKWDVNNWGFCWQSMDFVEGNRGYPEGSWDQRRQIASAHRDYQWGFLYFLQHDPSLPVDLRAEACQFGLCADEFTAAGGWPAQLYVREARRLVGRHLFTEHDARRDTRKQDAVAVGSYPMDSHATQWYRVGQRSPAPEGFFMCSARPYEIPYGCLLPESPSNLLVPVCLSASHAGYGTLRMEPVMMNLGMVSGVAAALAKQTGASVSDIEMDELQRRLQARGQVIRIP